MVCPAPAISKRAADEAVEIHVVLHLAGRSANPTRSSTGSAALDDLARLKLKKDVS